MIDKDIIARVGATVIVDLIRGLQSYGIDLLFDSKRLNRMMENEALRRTKPAAALFLHVWKRAAAIGGDAIFAVGRMYRMSHCPCSG